MCCCCEADSTSGCTTTGAGPATAFFRFAAQNSWDRECDSGHLLHLQLHCRAPFFETAQFTLHECEAVASMDFDRTCPTSLSREEEEDPCCLHRWTIVCTFVLYKNDSMLCVVACRAVVKSVPQPRGILLLDQREKGSFFECARGLCCLGDRCYLFFFHLDLLSCWVSYLSEREREGNLNETIWVECSVSLLQCECCLLNRVLVVIAHSWRKKTHNYGRACFLFSFFPLFVHILSPSLVFEFSNIWDLFDKVVFLFIGWKSSKLCCAVLFVSFFWRQTE